jgi:hypothetical protein
MTTVTTWLNQVDADFRPDRQLDTLSSLAQAYANFSPLERRQADAGLKERCGKYWLEDLTTEAKKYEIPAVTLENIGTLSQKAVTLSRLDMARAERIADAIVGFLADERNVDKEGLMQCHASWQFRSYLGTIRSMLQAVAVLPAAKRQEIAGQVDSAMHHLYMAGYNLRRDHGAIFDHVLVMAGATHLARRAAELTGNADRARAWEKAYDDLHFDLRRDHAASYNPADATSAHYIAITGLTQKDVDGNFRS